MDDLLRARPLLGTIVEMRVQGPSRVAALAAIEAAFAEVAAVHRLMSFHDAASELSRLNRDAAREAVDVDARTFEVLHAAVAMAAASQGRFDPCVAGRLVEWDLLPTPQGCGAPHPRADWRDIRLEAPSRVRFARPLWIDLGGIAKGYAVDRALAILRASGARAASVNAGGDLGRFGPSAEVVPLRIGDGTPASAVELGDGALASSVTTVDATRGAGRRHGVHLHGRLRRGVSAQRGVSVVAPSCMVADALTKVVLCDLRAGARLLRHHDASACVYDGERGWRRLAVR